MLSTHAQAYLPTLKPTDLLYFYQFLAQGCPASYPRLKCFLNDVTKYFFEYMTEMPNDETHKLLFENKNLFQNRLMFLRKLNFFIGENLQASNLIIDDILNGGHQLKALLANPMRKNFLINALQGIFLQPKITYTIAPSILECFQRVEWSLKERLSMHTNSTDFDVQNARILVLIQNALHSDAEKEIDQRFLEYRSTLLSAGCNTDNYFRQMAYLASLKAICSLRTGDRSEVEFFCELAISEQYKVKQENNFDVDTIKIYITDFLAALNDNALLKYRKGQCLAALKIFESCMKSANKYKVDQNDKTFAVIKENYLVVILSYIQKLYDKKEYSEALQLSSNFIGMTELFNANQLTKLRNSVTIILKKYDYFDTNKCYLGLANSYDLLKIYHLNQESLTNEDRFSLGKIKKNILLALYDKKLLDISPSLDILKSLILNAKDNEQDFAVIGRYTYLLIMLSVRKIHAIQATSCNFLFKEVLLCLDNYKILAGSLLHKLNREAVLPPVRDAMVFIFKQIDLIKFRHFDINSATSINRILKELKLLEFFSDDLVKLLFVQWKAKQIILIHTLLNDLFAGDNKYQGTFFKGASLFHKSEARSKLSSSGQDDLFKLKDKIDNLKNSRHPRVLPKLSAIDTVMDDLIALQVSIEPRLPQKSFRKI